MTPEAQDAAQCDDARPAYEVWEELSEVLAEDTDITDYANSADAEPVPVSVAVAESLDALSHCASGESYLAWLRYQAVADLNATVRDADATEGIDHDTDRRALDSQTQIATRVAMAMRVTQYAAQRTLGEAIVLRERLPRVSLCLRDGLITPSQVKTLIARTTVVDDPDAMTAIDTDLAGAVTSRAGQWSADRLRDLVDRIVFRHDADGARRRREKALAERGVHLTSGQDGMASLRASMSAENARIAQIAVEQLAATACKHDRRTKAARASDAFFSLITGSAFTCDCGRDDCDAVIPVPTQLSSLADLPTDQVKIVLHVVCDESTATGENLKPGFIDGYGVISGEQAYDIADRSDVHAKDVVADGGTEASPHLPSDPYRPSTALDSFVRIRDGYCTASGCNRPAWTADLDHVREYDHDAPTSGGQTEPANLNAKCRFHHILKSFSNWVDDQWVDENGCTRTEFRTPEGVAFDSLAGNEELFGGLKKYSWSKPDTPEPDPPGERTISDGARRDAPQRRQSRTKAKHARRRAERERNKHAREADEAAERKFIEQINAITARRGADDISL